MVEKGSRELKLNLCRQHIRAARRSRIQFPPFPTKAEEGKNWGSLKRGEKKVTEDRNSSSEPKRYENIDCLRAFSCIAIIAMHIRECTDYQIEGLVYNTFIPSWTWLVYLFLIISGFSMCCGYYSKIANRTIDMETFYIRRFKKTVPFFACLILLDIIVEPSLSALYEGLMELTMAFGLLPNNTLSVIGVAWTLGVIFLFYMLFPYFVFLIRNKKRAWLTLIVSLLINQMCSQYFLTEQFVIEGFTPRRSFLFCTPFFAGGGILYLYREEIEGLVAKHRWTFLAACVGATALWYILPEKLGGLELFTLTSLILFMLWLSYAIGAKSKFMNNKVMRYFGGISMEMYLTQLGVFRVIRRAGLLYVFGDGWLSFIVVMLLEIALLTFGIEVWRFVERKCAEWNKLLNRSKKSV